MLKLKLLSRDYFTRSTSLILIQLFLVIEFSTTILIQAQLQQQPNKLKDLSQSDSIVWDTSSLYPKQHNKNHVYRNKRSLSTSSNNNQLVDACQSKMEIITPYYATNSKGKVRTVVNSELMQQAIQIETCVR